MALGMSDGRPVVVMGRLMDEPKLRRSGSGGAALLKMELVPLRQGEGKRTTITPAVVIAVSIRGRLAEICAQFLRKGRKVMVAGSLRNHPNGKGRRRLEVIADWVQVLKPGAVKVGR